MPKFQYKAMNMSGHTTEGIFEGQDRQSVVDMLRSKTFYPLSITEVVQTNDIGREIGKKIPIKVLSLFCQQFATILSSGISVGQAMDIMSQQTENKRLQTVLKDVYEKVLTGQSLSKAFGDHAERFPTVFISMLAVGETSGTLETSFKRLHGYFKQEYTLVQKFRSSMVYPMIVSCLAISIVTFLLIFVVPSFKDIFDNAGVQLPLATRILMGLSDFLKQHYLIILIFIILAVIVFRFYSKSVSGRLSLDKLKLKIAGFGQLNRKLIVSRFTRSLSTMTSAGVPLAQALEITSQVVSNKFIEKQLRQCSEVIQQGLPLYKSLADIKMMPPMVVQMTRLGEESGSLDYLLEQTAVYYDSEAEIAITRLTAAIEPLIIVVMGAIVLFIMLAVLMPTFQLASLTGG